MADLKITEYRDLARDLQGNVVPVGLEPAIAIQTVAIDTASAASATLNELTRFVALQGDAACYLLFSYPPTAVTNSNGERLAANSEVYRGVIGKGLAITVKDTA